MIRAFLTDDAHARTRSLAAAMLCAALAGCGFGVLMPLVALNLEVMTGSGAIVGANAAMSALSIVVATPIIPALLARLPARRVLIACALLSGLGLIAFPAIRNVTFWFGLRFLVGFADAVIFVASETWINQLAKPRRRASLLAAYATVLSAGFGSGGVLLALLGSEGWAPWLAGAAVFILGALPIAILRGPGLEPPSKADAGPRAIARAGRLTPAAILAGLVFGALETNIFGLFPVYAERLGLTTPVIGLLVTVGALGAIVLQIPIGRFADRVGRLETLRLIAAASVALPIAILLAGASKPLLFPLIFVYVGVAGGFYTVGLARIGERLSGGALATANAAFVFAYGLGSLLGPPVSGAGMDAWDPQGLMAVAAALAGLYLVGTSPIVRRDRH